MQGGWLGHVGSGLDDSLRAGWQRCAYEALVHGTDPAVVRRVVTDLEASGECPPISYPLLDGPIDQIHGDSGDIDFGVPFGKKRLRILSSLRAWLSRLHNSTPSFYNGYHDWHVDGPGSYGREHKAYILVSKGVLPGGSSAQNDGRNTNDVSEAYGGAEPRHAPCDLSNLRLVPSHAHVWDPDIFATMGLRQSRPRWPAPEVKGCAAEFCSEPAGRVESSGGIADGYRSREDSDKKACAVPTVSKGSSFFGEHWVDTHARDKSWWEHLWERQPQLTRGAGGSFGEQPSPTTRERKLKAWGVPSDWAAIDRLGCNVSLDPGDILFWREDVWHRTQDVALDRIALRIDIQRLPFAGDRERYGA